jgi:CRP-like cAMP-binding protein
VEWPLLDVLPEPSRRELLTRARRRRFARKECSSAKVIPATRSTWFHAATSRSESIRPATVPSTQDVLAQLSGCTRPTANRVLRAGENAGVIEMARGRIEIVDLSAVQRRAR